MFSRFNITIPSLINMLDNGLRISEVIEDDLVRIKAESDTPC